MTVLAFATPGAKRRVRRRLLAGACRTLDGRWVAHGSHNDWCVCFWRRMDRLADFERNLLGQRRTLAFVVFWLSLKGPPRGKERELSASPARSRAPYAPMTDLALSRGTDFSSWLWRAGHPRRTRRADRGQSSKVTPGGRLALAQGELQGLAQQLSCRIKRAAVGVVVGHILLLISLAIRDHTQHSPEARPSTHDPVRGSRAPEASLRRVLPLPLTSHAALRNRDWRASALRPSPIRSWRSSRGPSRWSPVRARPSARR